MNWQTDLRHSQNSFDVTYPEKIPPHILNKLSDDIFRKQFQFSIEENESSGLADPIGDQIHAKGNGIIHRYPNRILYTPTTACPINCRYCFRKNELFSNLESFKPNLVALKTYLRNHPEVEEVILSGGDPLILSNQKLAEIFEVLYQCQIKYLRIHTRTPIAIPSRMDQKLLELLHQHRFKNLFFVLHSNHKRELDKTVSDALKEIDGNKIIKLTQTVLLKEINDNPDTLKDLFEKITEIGFRPYYLHHPDKVKGAMHFYLSETEGMKIYSALKKKISGWALPHYIIDNPEGLGKNLIINQKI